MSSTIKFIKILFPFPNKFIIIYFIYFPFPVLLTVKLLTFPTHYVQITKHTNQSQYITIHVMHIFPHNKIIKSHKTHQTHACGVLVLPRDFLGNLIPKLNIEPHLVAMFLHLKDYGLSPNPQSLGFHIPILCIKPPKW